MSDSERHPLDLWGERQDPPLKRAGIAQRLGVGVPYLSQVINGRKGLTLARAIEWSHITGLPIETFNPSAGAAASKQPEAAQ